MITLEWEYIFKNVRTIKDLNILRKASRSYNPFLRADVLYRNPYINEEIYLNVRASDFCCHVRGVLNEFEHVVKTM